MSALKKAAGVLGLVGLGAGYERYKNGKWSWPWQWWGSTSTTPTPGPGPGQPSVVNPPNNPNPPAQQPAVALTLPSAAPQPAAFVASTDTGDQAAGIVTSSGDDLGTGDDGSSSDDSDNLGDVSTDASTLSDVEDALAAL